MKYWNINSNIHPCTYPCIIHMFFWMDVITLLGNMGPIHQPISLEGVKIEMGSLTLVQYFIKFLIYIQLMCRLMNIYIFINLLKDLLLVPL
jgi:hypothetical protein